MQLCFGFRHSPPIGFPRNSDQFTLFDFPSRSSSCRLLGSAENLLCFGVTLIIETPCCPISLMWLYNVPFLFVYRLGRKLREVMETLRDQEVVVISTVPLPPLEAWFSNHFRLHMSWTEELHVSCVYSSRCS